MFNVKTLAIHRPTVVSGNRKDYTDSGRTITGRLGPQDTEFGAIAGMGYGKSYTLFSNDTGVDLKEADRLVVDGDEFNVKGVQVFPHAPAHVEVSLEKVIKK